MKKKNVLKVICIILLIILIVFLIHTFRNYIIIRNMQNKISNYVGSTNYHSKSVSTEDDNVVVTMDYYKKDNKEVTFIERKTPNETNKISMYNNGERIDTFYETGNNKIASLNTNAMASFSIYNGLETDSNFQTFYSSILAIIKSERCNGKDCYSIKNYLSPFSLIGQDGTLFIDKDTGLLVKSIEDSDKSLEREYDFNNVNDSIFAEPDISQYTIN